MFKNHVDSFKLDTNINLILQESRKTIRGVKKYLAEPDELNFAISSARNFDDNASSREGINFTKMVHKTEVPPVWDEDLQQIYVKSLVENYLSPRPSVEDYGMHLTNVPSMVPNISNQFNPNNNNKVLLLRDFSSNNGNFSEQTEDLPSDLQWKPLKRTFEAQKTLNQPSTSPNLQKMIKQQKIVSADKLIKIPKSKSIKNKNPISNRTSNDITNQNFFSNSARSCKPAGSKNPINSNIEPTFIRFIGKHNKNPIDFNKEHPGLIVESLENCKTLFPRRLFKKDNTGNNIESIESKINSIPSTALQEDKIDQKSKQHTIKDNGNQSCHHKTELRMVGISRTEHNSCNKIKNKEKINLENINQIKKDATTKIYETKIFDMMKQNICHKSFNNAEGSTISKNEFVERILKDFMNYQNGKLGFKHQSKLSAKSKIADNIVSCEPRKKPSENNLISSHGVQNEYQRNMLCSHNNDIPLSENSIPKQNEAPTWHEVLTDKNVEQFNLLKMKDSVLQNKIAENKDTSRIDRNLEIIYDKSNGFEVKLIPANNNEKLKKLKIKTLPVFCIRGEFKVQKAISIEISPEKSLNPKQFNNVKLFQFNHNAQNIEEETPVGNVNLDKTEESCTNNTTLTNENQISRKFNVLNEEENFKSGNSLSTIEENDNDNQSNEKYSNIVNRDSQSKIITIIPKNSSNLLTSKEQNLSQIDSNDEQIFQHEKPANSNLMLSTTTVSSGSLNSRNLEVTLSTQTDTETLGIQRISIYDTNRSEQNSENDNNMKISNQIPDKKLSFTSVNNNKNCLRNHEVIQSTDLLSILENVFLKAFKSNTSSPKQEILSSTSRSLLETPERKRKEALKKKNNLTKHNRYFGNIFKEVSVQTDEILSHKNIILNQLTEQDTHENLVDNIFDKIRNDIPVGLKEFKSYSQLKTENFKLLNLEKKHNTYEKIRNLKQANKVNKYSIIEEEKKTLDRSIISSNSAYNNQVNPVASSFVLTRTSNENNENNKKCIFRLHSDLNNSSTDVKRFDIKETDSKSEPNNLQGNTPMLQSKPETFGCRNLRNNYSHSNLSSVYSENNQKSTTNTNLQSNFNLELNDGTASMFSLGSDGIVFDQINYQYRNSNIRSNKYSGRNNQNNREMQSDQITKTIEKVLKDGESFRSKKSNKRKSSKESNKKISPEIENAVKYFLDNLNNSENNSKKSGNSSCYTRKKNDTKMNNILQMTSDASLHSITDHYKSINNSIKSLVNPDNIRQHHLDLHNILGCNSNHNPIFDISEKSSDTFVTDKLGSKNNYKTKNCHMNKSHINSYDNSSTTSQIFKNFRKEKKRDFENFLIEHISDSSCNIDLHDLYSSSTDEILLSGLGEDKEIVINDSDLKNTAEADISVSDGEILSIGEIKNIDK